VVIVAILAVSVLLVVSANPIRSVSPQLAPDLQPANAELSPVPAYEGDKVEVTVTIVNVGDAAAVAGTVELIDARPNGDVVRIGATPLSDPLPPGGSTIVHTPQFFAVGVGEHTLAIRVGNVTPVEANAGNDALSAWMQVLPAKAPPPPPPSDGVRVEALATLGFGAFVGFLFVIGIIAVIVVLLSHREPYAAVPPPPEPPDRSPPPIWPP